MKRNVRWVLIGVIAVIVVGSAYAALLLYWWVGEPAVRRLKGAAAPPPQPQRATLEPEYKRHPPKSLAELAALRTDDEVHSIVTEPATETTLKLDPRLIRIGSAITWRVASRLASLPRCYNNVRAWELEDFTRLLFPKSKQLSPEQWLKGARTLGLDYVVLSAHEQPEKPGQCALRFQILDVRRQRSLAPVRVCATPEDLVNRLPAICVELARRCGVDLSPEERRRLEAPPGIDVEGLLKSVHAANMKFSKSRFAAACAGATEYPQDPVWETIVVETIPPVVRPDDAARVLLKAAQERPLSRSLWWAILEGLVDVGAWTDLERAKRLCDDVFPDDLEALLTWGRAAPLLNRSEKTIAALEARIPTDPTCCLLYRQLGLQHSRRSCATRRARSPARISPREWRIIHNGYLKALDAYGEAVTIHPRFGIAWGEQVMPWGALGDIETARRCYKKAIEYSPTQGVAYADMFFLCLPQWYDDPEGIKQVLADARAVKHPPLELCRAMADACWKGQYLKEARHYAQVGLKATSQSDLELLYYMCAIELDSGRTDEATRYVERAMEVWGNRKDPNHDLCYRAEALLKRDQPQVALPIYRRMVKNGIQPGYAHINLGICAYAAHHYAEAETMWKKAVSLKGPTSETKLGMALLANHDGNLVAARKLLREAVARQPDILEADTLRRMLWPSSLRKEILELKRKARLSTPSPSHP